MKDLNGKEINFADEKLFPPEFMMPKRNHLDIAKIHYEDKTDDEIAEDLAECMHSMDAVFE